MPISLIEAKPQRGECRNCKKDERCHAWWKKDVENGATCVKKTDKYYLPDFRMTKREMDASIGSLEDNLLTEETF